MFAKRFSLILTLVLLAPTAASAEQVALFFPSYSSPSTPAMEAPVVPAVPAVILPPDAEAVTATTRGWDGKEVLTRATFVAAITRRLYHPSERCFPKLSGSDYSLLANDVPKDAVYGPDLCTAMRAGLMQGFTDGGFHPKANVTVEQAAKVLAKAFSLGADPIDPAQPWSGTRVKALQDAGVISLTANLNAPITRDELSAMFWKLRDLKKQAK